MRTLQMRALLDSIDRHFNTLEMGVSNPDNVKGLITLLMIEDHAEMFNTEHCKRMFMPIVNCLTENNCYIDEYPFCAKETDSKDGYRVENEQLSYLTHDDDDFVRWSEIYVDND